MKTGKFGSLRDPVAVAGETPAASFQLATTPVFAFYIIFLYVLILRKILKDYRTSGILFTLSTLIDGMN